VDAILARLADRRLFPKLDSVVIAGFSAGGQIVQRYAVVGHGEASLTRVGIATRYVVSDPSSYLYFDAGRPAPAPGCKTVNTWRYGFESGVTPYVTSTPASLEARYVTRDVTYLMGMADTDPNHPVLDKSCAGIAQGPQRFARGHAYFSMLQARDGAALRHVMIDVPGIAHEGAKMFNSACGLAALFGTPGCAELDAKH
jgi:pimeloyl-ACP methyl ester carboxylesterase